MSAKRVQGFTLIELMVAVAILAILATLAVPSFNTFIANAQVRNAAEEIQNGLQQARGNAVLNNGSIPADNTYNIPAAIVGATNARLTVAPAGTAAITFNALGRQSAPGVAVTIDVDNPGAGACLAAAGRVRCLRVLITTMGQVRMCDPSQAAGDPRACPN